MARRCQGATPSRPEADSPPRPAAHR